jgi:hypothetical protein
MCDKKGKGRLETLGFGGRTGVDSLGRTYTPSAWQAGEWWQKGFEGFAQAEGCGEEQPWPWDMNHRDT